MGQCCAACGVSVTSFAGLHRQILLDMLHCMGVDVQKEMRLTAVTHIVARDVNDRSSKKLEHARRQAQAAKHAASNPPASTVNLSLMSSLTAPLMQARVGRQDEYHQLQMDL